MLRCTRGRSLVGWGGINSVGGVGCWWSGKGRGGVGIGIGIGAGGIAGIREIAMIGTGQLNKNILTHLTGVSLAW